MSQAKSIGRRIFQVLCVISFLLFLSVAPLWIAAAVHPRWRVTFQWTDEGATVKSSNTATGWSRDGIYQTWFTDEFRFPDLQSAQAAKQFFAQATPAGTARTAVVTNANTAIMIYKPPSPLTGLGTLHQFRQQFHGFPDYAARFAILPAVYLLDLLWFNHSRRNRWRRGLCTNCLYDLQGNSSGVCPECGATIKPPAAEPRGL